MEAMPKGPGGPEEVHNEADENFNREEDDDQGGDDIPSQIARALRNFAPYFTRQIQETMESAVNTEIARHIKEEISAVLKDEVSILVRDELDKRLPQKTVEQPENRVIVTTEQGGASSTSKDKFTLKNFTVVNPPTYDGNPDPIVSTHWISEVDGAFRVTRSPLEWKVTLASSLLRGAAKRWWDDKVTLLGEDAINRMEWDTFKSEFFKFFRSEAEVAKLRSEFLTTYQGSKSLNEFKTQQEERKRKAEQSHFQDSAKRGRTGEVHRGNRPLCHKCNRYHFGECRSNASSSASSPSKTCYKCGKPGHISFDCPSAPKPVLVCFHCNKPGHKKSNCPSLSEADRNEEKRKEAERAVARNFGNQRSRSYQMTT